MARGIFQLETLRCEQPWSDLGPDGHAELRARVKEMPEPVERQASGLRHVCTVQAHDGPRQIAVIYDYRRRLRKVFIVRCLEPVRAT